MQFTIPKSSLLAALRLAAGVADRKSTMPILGNVLLRVTKRTLLVAATDLTVSLSAEVELAATPKPTDGALTLSAATLREIVEKAPGDTISVKRTDNNWAEIKSGKASYKVVGLVDRDFPKLPDHREVSATTVDAARFVQLIDRTFASVCQDETRHHLCGVLLTFDKGTSSLTAVSTDGHRLSVAVAPLELALPVDGVIVPLRGLVAIRHLFKQYGAESCSLAVSAGCLFVRYDATTLAVKLVDGKFPPWQQVMPTKKTATVTVNRQALLDCIRRMQSMTTDQRGMRLTLTGETLHVRADNPDLGEVEESLDVSVIGKMSEPFGANPKYVAEMLAVLDCDSVDIEISAALDPVLVKPTTDDGFRGVVMPMRVN